MTSDSVWSATAPPAGGEHRRGGPFPGDVDVAIVGAGYTGLWSALALATIDPTIRIAVVEANEVGFGASGRNGGWCSALLPIGLDALAARHGRAAATALQRAMFSTVADVVAFAADADADDQLGVAHGGTLTLARSARQHERLRADHATAARFGIADDDLQLLDASAAAARCNATGVRGGLFSPHCAAIHPLRLVRAIADAAERRGVQIVEHVAVTDVAPRRLTTSGGTIRADTIVLATEAFTVDLPGRRRDLLPIYSMMIATPPLAAAVWDEIGLTGRPTFADARHSVIYGQRTADGRIAFGGRGAPYHFGSRIRPEFDRDDAVRKMLTETLSDLFPVLADVPITHHWGGPLGVPRDWHPHVRLDRSTGLATVGGYAGDGVAAAHLAGHTLADLIAGRDTWRTALPLVDHRSPRWEPEPLRWLGVRLTAAAARRADSGGRGSSLWDRLFCRLRG